MPTFSTSCPPNAYFDPDTDSCTLKNQDGSAFIQDSPALTTAQAIGIGIVIGAFIVAVIGTLLFLFLRKRRAGKKNAIIMVSDGKKDDIEPDKPAYPGKIRVCSGSFRILLWIVSL